MSNERTSERRKHARSQAKYGVLVSLGTEAEKLWHVIDISEGGLAFRYLEGLTKPQFFSELALLTKDTTFCLENLRFTVITDFETGERFLSRYSSRRCGVQFGQLTKHQSIQLKNFITNYASVGAEMSLWHLSKKRLESLGRAGERHVSIA